MKTQFIITAAVVASLVGCASNKQFSEDSYGQRAKTRLTYNEEVIKKTVDESPDWMKKLPKSTHAIYANGTALSNDYEMAVTKAKLHAFGKICMTAGGTVDKRSRTFQTDADDVTTSNSENAIQTNCKDVDITGIEPADQKVIPSGNRFRAYVLIALPTGEANVIQKDKRKHELQLKSLDRSREVFKEITPEKKSDSNVKETVVADYSKAASAEDVKRAALLKSLERAQLESSKVIELKTTVR